MYHVYVHPASKSTSHKHGYASEVVEFILALPAETRYWVEYARNGIWNGTTRVTPSPTAKDLIRGACSVNGAE